MPDEIITTDDLHRKYGKNIQFLFKGQEPFMGKNGRALGVLIEKDNKVLCNECDDWFSTLGNHVSLHNLTARSYKEKWGFNKDAPLCTREHSRKLREGTINAMKKAPWLRTRALEALKEGHKTMNKRQNPLIGKRNAIQKANKRNSCPAQMIERYRLLRQRYGENVSLNIVRQVDPGLDAYACRHYGSWNKWKEHLGLSVDKSSYRKDEATLIYDLRQYIQFYQSLPWDSITKRRLNGFQHMIVPYERVWGSFSRACMSIGIFCDGWLSTTNGTRKRWKISL